jgi:DNA-binding PadR family transcriptional regulator
MIPQSHAELLTILIDAPTSGLMTSEIFKIACDNTSTQIPDPESLSKMLYSVRSKGFITSSDGKKRVHKITPKGIYALDDFNGVADFDAPNEINETEETALMTVDNMLEGICQESPFLLDPNNELDAPFISIITALREAQSRPEPIKIERKDDKISTLRRLGALMSDDIKLIFDDIVADLELIENA